MLSGVALLFAPLLPGLEHTTQWIASVITLAVALITWRLVVAAIERFYARRFVSRFIPRVSTYKSLSKSLGGALILALAAIELLHIWSVNVTPALWSATFVSAAIAFGAQAIVRDVLTGVFYLFEDTYDVGDGVEFTTTNGTVTGVVDAIGLRQTRLIDQQGRAVSIPNGSIVYVTNATRLPSRASIKIVLPLRANVQELRRRIADIATRAAAEVAVDPGSIAVRLDDATADTVSFSVDFEAGRLHARSAEATMRERLVMALQADGSLPGAPPPSQSGAL